MKILNNIYLVISIIFQFIKGLCIIIKYYINYIINYIYIFKLNYYLFITNESFRFIKIIFQPSDGVNANIFKKQCYMEISCHLNIFNFFLQSLRIIYYYVLQFSEIKLMSYDKVLDVKLITKQSDIYYFIENYYFNNDLTFNFFVHDIAMILQNSPISNTKLYNFFNTGDELFLLKLLLKN